MLQGPLPSLNAERSRPAAIFSALRGSLLPLVMLSVKVATAGSMALVFVLASRSMDNHDFGRLSVWFNVVSFVAVIAAISQDGIIIRLWFEYLSRKEYGLALGAFRSGWMVAGIGGCLFGLAVAAMAYFVEGAGMPSALAVGVFVLMSALTLYAASCGRNIIDVLSTTALTDLPWRLGLIGMAGFCLYAGLELTIPEFFFTAATGMLVGTTATVILTLRRFPVEVRNAAPLNDRRRWAILSGRMLLPTTMEAISQYAEVILIGLFLHPAAAGGFFAAQRIAAVFPMLMTGILGYTSNRTPRLYFDGQTVELQALFRRSMRVLIPMVVLALVFVLVAGPFLLGLFGPEYRDEYLTLILLSLGYGVLACGGTAIMNLLLTGHEGAYIRIQGVSLMVRMGLVVLLSGYFGSAGAAAAILIVNGPLTMALVMASRRRLGADPSIMALFARQA